MDLAQRLAKVQTKGNQEVADLSHLTIDDLQDRVVDFGTKHKGHSFQHIWLEDQEWVKFMCSHYHKSQKSSHRLFLRYVELMVEQLENNGQVVEVTIPTSSTQLPNDVTLGYPQVKAFAKAKMKPMNSQKTSGRVRSTEVVENPLEEEEDWSEAEMIESFNQAADIQTLQARMLNMENALQQIIQHITENKEK